MKNLRLFSAVATIFCTSVMATSAQNIFESDNSEFRVSGYLRTGVGASEGGATQAHFHMPGALNKYCLGNQAETYGELEFDYTLYLDAERSRSLDAVWMTSIYEDFGTRGRMNFNSTEQLYLRANNLFGRGESIWGGNRFYERRAIGMIDRQWLNPGQHGWGFGIENLLNGTGDEDLKFAAWRFKNEDVVSYINGNRDDLYNYTVDARWVNRAISESLNINFALNYSYRAASAALDYDSAHGAAAFSWLDYSKGDVTNSTAFIVRYGANITVNHWSGVSQVENPSRDNYVTSDLTKAYSFELSNDFLYDDMENFALNIIALAVARNYGTSPYNYVNGEAQYLSGRGDMIYWLTAGVRGSYYICDNLRLTAEYSHEYINNQQIDAAGHLNKFTFTPEITLSKGYYSRPALRPFVNYAIWSESLRGMVATTPSGSPYGNSTSGFTYGLQFEIWW